MDPGIDAAVKAARAVSERYRAGRAAGNSDSAVVPGAALRVSRADELEHNYRHNMKGRNPSFGSEAFKAVGRGAWNAGAFLPALANETGEWLYEKATGDDSESDGFDIDGAMTEGRRFVFDDNLDRGDLSQMSDLEKAALISLEYGPELVLGGLGAGAALKWGVKGAGKLFGKKSASSVTKESTDAAQNMGKKYKNGTASPEERKWVEKALETSGPAAAFVRRGMENAGGKLGVAAAFSLPFSGAMFNGALNDNDLASMEAGGRFGQLVAGVGIPLGKAAVWGVGQGARKFKESQFVKEAVKQGKTKAEAVKEFAKEYDGWHGQPTPEMRAGSDDAMQAYEVIDSDGNKILAVDSDIGKLLLATHKATLLDPKGKAIAAVKEGGANAPITTRKIGGLGEKNIENLREMLGKKLERLGKETESFDSARAEKALADLTEFKHLQKLLDEGANISQIRAVQKARRPYLNNVAGAKQARAARKQAGAELVDYNDARIKTQYDTNVAVEDGWRMVSNKYQQAHAAGKHVRFKFPISDEIMKRASDLENLLGKVMFSAPRGVQNFFKKAKARNAENDKFRAGVGEKLGSFYIPPGVDRTRLTEPNADVAMTGSDLIDFYHFLSKDAQAATGGQSRLITEMKQNVIDVANKPIGSKPNKLFADRWKSAMAEYKRMEEITHGDYSAAARVAGKRGEKFPSLFTDSGINAPMLSSLVRTLGDNGSDVLMRQVRGDFADGVEKAENPTKFIVKQLRGAAGDDPFHGASNARQSFSDGRRTVGGEASGKQETLDEMYKLPDKVRAAMEDETRNIVMRYLDGSDTSGKFFGSLTGNPDAARRITELMNSAPPAIKNEYLQAVGEYAVLKPDLFKKGKQSRSALENVFGKDAIKDLQKWAAHSGRDVAKSYHGLFDQQQGGAINKVRFETLAQQFGESGAMRLAARRFFEKYTENFGRPNARPLLDKMDDTLYGDFTPLGEVGKRLQDRLRATADEMVLQQLGVNSGGGINDLFEQVARRDGSFDENAWRTLLGAMDKNKMAANVIRKRVGERMADAMDGDGFDEHIRRFGAVYKEVLGDNYRNLLAIGELLKVNRQLLEGVDYFRNKSVLDPVAEYTGVPLERVMGRWYAFHSAHLNRGTLIGSVWGQGVSSRQKRAFNQHVFQELAGAYGNKAMREGAVNPKVFSNLFALMRSGENAKPLWDLLGGEKYLVAGALSGGGGAGGRTHGDMQNQQLQYNLTREAEERGSVDSERAKKELQTYQRFYDPRYGTKILRGQRQRGEVQ